jgi:NAD(P)H-dependent flavin oxidoreductase YrpB (nitropropane dioxygenase family)
VIQGGMTFGSDARLVAAVSASGGLGTLGTFHYRGPDLAATLAAVREQVEAIRAATDAPFAVNVPFFERGFELVEALAREVGVTTFALGGWFSEPMAQLKHELGLTVLVSVNSPTVARMIEGRPLDALIVQGNESGGANSHYTTSQLFDLLAPESPVPVLLAGGQWDGADLHRALLGGAAGIQLGTRFFLSEESPLHPSIKAQVLDHNLKRPLTTSLTPVTDTLNMRFVTNKPYKQALRSGEVREIFQDKDRVFELSRAFFSEQARPLLLYAGTGVYKLRRIEPCAEIVNGILADYEALRGATLPPLGSSCSAN